jgi:alpha-glucosidase
MGKYAVDVEEKDKYSTLNMYRQALALRRKLQTAESVEIVDNPSKDVLHFKRPNGWEVVLNAGKTAVELPTGSGEVLISSNLEVLDGKLPGETAVWIKNE